jgi:hypothetical protein
MGRGRKNENKLETEGPVVRLFHLEAPKQYILDKMAARLLLNHADAHLERRSFCLLRASLSKPHEIKNKLLLVFQHVFKKNLAKKLLGSLRKPRCK